VRLYADGTPQTDQDKIVTGGELVLAEIAVRNCKLAKDISIVQRRNARPPEHPYIACGSEQPTAWAPWHPWSQDDGSPSGLRLAATVDALRVVGGLRAEIDTSRAGFLTTPDYFARIDGPRIGTTKIDEKEVVVVVEGLLSVVEPTALGFTAQVVVVQFDAEAIHGITPRAARATRPSTPAKDGELMDVQWSVGWMGVEG
jgi:hypothetical protein